MTPSLTVDVGDVSGEAGAVDLAVGVEPDVQLVSGGGDWWGQLRAAVAVHQRRAGTGAVVHLAARHAALYCRAP